MSSDSTTSGRTHLAVYVYLFGCGLAAMTYFGSASPTFTSLSFAGLKLLATVTLTGAALLFLLHSEKRFSGGEAGGE